MVKRFFFFFFSFFFFSDRGAISGKAAGLLADPEIAHHFALCIQRVMPKSYVEAMKEVTVTRDFLYNFAGLLNYYFSLKFSVWIGDFWWNIR
jgi:hypothetical protein